MNRHFLLIISVLALMVLAAPVIAQEDSGIPTVEIIPISGTFSYTYEILHMGATENFLIQHARENEIWSGDLEGTAETIYFLEFWESPPQLRGSFLIEFSGSLMDEYEGTLTMIMAGSGIANPMLMDMESSVPFGVTGEFRIVSGTGDFEHVYGYGQWWGPGNPMNDPDHSVPDIAYQGEIMFMEPPEQANYSFEVSPVDHKLSTGGWLYWLPACFVLIANLLATRPPNTSYRILG